MPGDNVLGSVSIVITGDTSRLQGDFARAQAIAQQSGAQISASLAQGITPGIRGAAITFGQLGDSIKATIPPTQAAGSAFEALKAEFADLNGIEEANFATSNAFAASQEKVATSSKHATSEIQATSGALRVLEGSGGIRAAERFIATTLGFGPALQSIFPIVGAIALTELLVRAGEHLGKITGLWGGVSEAEKQATEQAAALDKQITAINENINRINTGIFKSMFGEAAARGRELAGLSLGTGEKDITALRTRIAAGVADIERLKGEVQKEIDKAIGTEPGSEPAPGSLQTPEKVAQQPGGAAVNAYREAIKKQQELNKELNEIEAKQAEVKEQIRKQSEDDQRQALSAEASIRIAELNNVASTNKQLADLDKAKAELRIRTENAARKQEIEGIQDAGTRAIAAADLAVTIANERETALGAIIDRERKRRIDSINAIAEQEKIGKTRPEQEVIETKRQGDVRTAEREAALANFALYAEEQEKDLAYGDAKATAERGWAEQFTREWEQSFEKVRRAREKSFIEENAPGAFGVLAAQRVSEIQTKGKGTTDELAIDQQRLLLEQRYGLEGAHTAAQQIAFIRQRDSLESEARATRVADLQTGLAMAQVDAESVRGTEKQIEADGKVASLQNEISVLIARNENLDIQAATRRLELEQKLTLEYRLRAAFTRAGQAVPGAIGGAVAKGVFDGKGIGRDIRDELKGIGQQLLGTALTAVIHQLIIKLGIEAAAQATLGAIFGTTASAAAVASAANTAAVVVGTAVNTGLIVSNTALTGAVIALADIMAVQTFLGGFAEGGDPPTDRPSFVGERGKEIFWPKAAGTIIPNDKIKDYSLAMGGRGNIASSSAATALPGLNLSVPMPGLPAPNQISGQVPPSSATAGGGTNINLHNAQFHGVQNVRQLMREIAAYAKNASPQFSPYAR